jgi:hypothetical protein
MRVPIAAVIFGIVAIGVAVGYVSNFLVAVVTIVAGLLGLGWYMFVADIKRTD